MSKSRVTAAVPVAEPVTPPPSMFEGAELKAQRALFRDISAAEVLARFQ